MGRQLRSFIRTGFPFDRDFENRSPRGDSFQSQLDDIVQRHPDLAGHFDEFPFRSSGRRQRPARPSAFDSFGAGFSFGRDPFQEYYNEDAPPQQQQQQQPETSTTSNQKQQQQTQTDETDSSSKDESRDQQRGRRPNNIQQSQTVDLGQKQEPAVNDRNQRSMSAPPSQSRTGGTGQRFVSSINIPIGGMGDMGAQQSQQQQQQPQQSQEKQTTSNKPTERVIPIHVEGRDEPVVPKHSGPSFTSSSQQQQQPPQAERIFGQRPSQFTQFVGSQRPFAGQAQPPQQQRPSEEAMRQQQQQYQQQQQQKFQKKQEEAQQEAAPVQAQKINTPIDLIKSIQVDVSALMAQVEKFGGMPRDKQYLYLDEMLTRNLIKLDDIDTQGQENIRQARKEAIKCIQECISILEAKAAANAAPPITGEDVQSEKMEVEAEKEATEVRVPEEKEEKMEETAGEKKEEKVDEAKKDESQVVEEEKKSEDVKAEGDSLAAASAAENVVKK